MHQRIFILVFCLVISVGLQAQEGDNWSLEKCINYAIQNSLSVEQASLGISQAKLTNKQAVWAQAPTLNGSFRHGFNFGRSVDLTSYSFVDQTTNSSSISLNLSQTIFQGFQVRNTIKQSKVDLEASMKDAEQAKNDIALSVAQGYLSILLAQESREVLVEQAKVTIAQYEQTEKLIAAGVLAENSRYDLEAQMARDEENVVVANNTVDLAYVNLKVLMNVDVGKDMTIEPVDELQIPEPSELVTLGKVYEEALENQPNIVATHLRERSAELGVKIAKGGLWPTLSFYGAINTNYSSAARMFQQAVVGTNNITGTVNSTGEPVTVSEPIYGAEPGQIIPYFLQLGGNITGNLGLNLSVPIFNGMRTRINIQRAELGIRSAKLATTQLEMTLKSNIKRSLTEVTAAEKRLAAANKTVVSTRLSVQNTRKRYDLGVVNSFELTSVQNTLIGSESNLLQAKYDYLFKLKILDYYRGRRIEIK
jgi:outer membrane protein